MGTKKFHLSISHQMLLTGVFQVAEKMEKRTCALCPKDLECSVLYFARSENIAAHENCLVSYLKNTWVLLGKDMLKQKKNGTLDTKNDELATVWAFTWGFRKHIFLTLKLFQIFSP